MTSGNFFRGICQWQLAKLCVMADDIESKILRYKSRLQNSTDEGKVFLLLHIQCSFRFVAFVLCFLGAHFLFETVRSSRSWIVRYPNCVYWLLETVSNLYIVHRGYIDKACNVFSECLSLIFKNIVKLCKLILQGNPFTNHKGLCREKKRFKKWVLQRLITREDAILDTASILQLISDLKHLSGTCANSYSFINVSYLVSHLQFNSFTSPWGSDIFLYINCIDCCISYYYE